jgi:predicted transcriptional regulator of viral defense system
MVFLTRKSKIMQVVNKILMKIEMYGPRAVFTSKDFLDLGSRDAVDQALSRLCRKGKIRRLARGIYDYPKKHDKLGMLSPDPLIVVQAIAKNKNAKLQTSGAYSANLLGLSDQVPAKIVFLTDSDPQKLKIINFTVFLKHVAPSALIGAGTLSGTIIQAIKYLGKTNIKPYMIQKIRNQISDQDKMDLRKNKLKTPEWMHSIIEEIIKN